MDLPKGFPRMDMPWLNVVPEALYWAARHVVSEGGFAGDLVVSENGCAALDEINRNGEIIDLDRISYLRSCLKRWHRAFAEGLPVKAYFLWSLTDDFEWSWGFSKRFGIIYETQTRIPKESARWYAECLRQNRVV